VCGAAPVLLGHTVPIAPDSQLESARTVPHAMLDGIIMGVADSSLGLAPNAQLVPAVNT
jgi:hypothetical protein